MQGVILHCFVLWSDVGQLQGGSSKGLQSYSRTRTLDVPPGEHQVLAFVRERKPFIRLKDVNSYKRETG